MYHPTTTASHFPTLILARNYLYINVLPPYVHMRKYLYVLNYKKAIIYSFVCLFSLIFALASVVSYIALVEEKEKYKNKLKINKN